MSYSNESTLSVEKAISTNYEPVSGLLEDLVGSVEPPFVVSLSVVATVPTSSRVDVKMNRSGPNHAEIVVEMGEEWDYSINPGEWRRAARAIAAYLFSTTSKIV